MITKAYDVKALGEYLKEAGLPIAEDAIESAGKNAYVAVKKWLNESAVLSETKIDDVIVPFISQLDSVVEGAIEGLDLDGDGK